MERFNPEKHTCRPFDPQILLYQMQHPDKWTFFAWGASKFSQWKNLYVKFWVNGAKHRGYVYVTLNGADLYDVFIVSTKGNLKDSKTDIYFEDLQREIDHLIERDRREF